MKEASPEKLKVEWLELYDDEMNKISFPAFNKGSMIHLDADGLKRLGGKHLSPEFAGLENDGEGANDALAKILPSLSEVEGIKSGSVVNGFITLSKEPESNLNWYEFIEHVKQILIASSQ